MSDCLFCKIISKKIPAKVVYEDDLALAFEDVNPQAPIHILIVPKKHISTVLDITDEEHHLIGHLLKVANKVASDRGIAERGFRVVTNCNHDGGQTVYHIHFHVIGGRQMHWPPG